MHPQQHNMSKSSFIKTIVTILIISGITSGVFLYTSGYRFEKPRANNSTIDLTKTGMISVKSIPDGASVYMDTVLRTATNGTLSGIEPGMQELRIVKQGYVEWTKKIEVFPELVTDITAVLVSQTPRLEPLTNTGASSPSISFSLGKLAYFSKDNLKPGIWVIPLTQGALSIFRANSYIVIQDTTKTVYSQGKSIEWSPDEKKLLIGEKDNTFHILDLQTNTVQATSSAEIVRNKWNEELGKKRTDFVERLDIPNETKIIATSIKSVWSPDDKKFLYTRTNGDKIEYRVYNMEKPIPIGENVDNLVFTTLAKDPQPKLTWYSDSFHLIITQMDTTDKTKGTISLIRIDGTNKTEVYNNTLYSDMVYSTPGGEKLIVLTSFKSNGETNLYTISLR